MPPSSRAIDRTTSGSSDLLATLGAAGTGRVAKALRYYLIAKQGHEIATSSYQWIRNRLTYSVAVAADDDLYPALEAWLASVVPSRQQRNLRARTARSGYETSDSDSPTVSPDSTMADRTVRLLRFTIDSSQRNVVDIGGHRVAVRQEVPEGGESDDERKAAFLRRQTKIVFDAFNTAARDAVIAHLAQLHAEHQRSKRRPSLRIASRWGGWQERSDLPLRRLDTVVIDDAVRDAIIGHLDRFIASEADYAVTGTPYHTGIMLSGPPGTGKTSIFKAIANHFDLDVYLLPLNDVESDSDLMRMVNQIPPGSMLVIEDADVFSMTADREGGDGTRKDDAPDLSSATLSGLLNAMDGLATPHGVIFGITSNFEGELDAALVRPGRIDLRLKIGYLDAYLAEQLVAIVTRQPSPCIMRVPDELTAPQLVNALRSHPGDVHAALAAAGIR